MRKPSLIPAVGGLALIWLAAANGAEIRDLPVPGSADKPSLLLELGSAPPSVVSKDAATRVVVGEVVAHVGDASIQTDKDEISSLHAGFGTWSVAFRFPLAAKAVANPYTFWARWRQGGDPAVCEQTFEVWAGPDAAKLVQRAALKLKPKGWDYAWIAAEQPVALKADDAVVEVRESGAGHDAKVFDAFLLGPPPAPPTLPASGTDEKPVVLLELGKEPRWLSAPADPAMRVIAGQAEAGEGAGALATEKDEALVFHQGFGAWGAAFQFDLRPAVAPGLYRIYARYKSGGEVSQVAQTFTVKAGSNAGSLATRTSFRAINSTPWEYQWLKSPSPVAVLPGDGVLRIENAGKADGAKVFDAFLLQLESPLDGGMNAEQAQARNRFLALTRPVADAQRRLYVLDGAGAGPGGDALLGGLAAAPAQPWYDRLAVTYLIGPEAKAMAERLNLTALPAAILTDGHYTLLGALANPKQETDVAKFLADPAGIGFLPAPASAAAPEPKPLADGIPEAWLVGGLQDGPAGVSVHGLDTETVLRPNPAQPYLSTQLMGGEMRVWRRAPAARNGVAVIEESAAHSYGWSKGSGYAQLYLHAEKATQALLHLRQSGIESAAWLDGRPVALAVDPNAPADFPAGGQAEPPQAASLDLAPGWHSLLVKLVMRHEQGQRFSFAARFTDAFGRPLDSVETQLADPTADLVHNAIAAKLRPQIYVDAPANLPRPGDPLKLHADIRWHPILEEPTLPAPLTRFKAKLRLRLVDYSGRAVAVREIEGLFPGEANVDFGQAPEAGYYAVYPSLHSNDGKLVMAYHADGFSVVRGNAAQKARLDAKKLWNNYYYAFADGDQGFRGEGGYFAWLERMGIYKSYGAYPGFEERYRSQWQAARQRGIVLFGDSSGDSHWLNDKAEDGQKYTEAVSPYTRFFKSTNEIDIRREAEWKTLRDPAHWVQRAQREFEQVHKARKDAHYVGGSLVRPGDPGSNQEYADGRGPGKWFSEALKLGLDKYQDAWDVHAYPQNPPRFGQPLGNGDTEDERGVLAAYASLGRQNTLPFWLGEAGAKAAHGYTGRRWQAEQAAKMIAWINSRSDYLGIAFCIAHEYDWGYGRVWDYSMGHKPGEAALYTAGVLIDGLPYKAVDTRGTHVQAGYFGDTLMLWRADDAAGEWRTRLDASKLWLLVDVVGQARELKTAPDGTATIPLSSSPVYVLTKQDYERLTGG